VNTNKEIKFQKPSFSTTKFLALGLLFVAIIGSYIFIIRPTQLNWGATEAEIQRAMPGDDLVADPTFLSTRAISINGTPQGIWPWLIQMGYGRAGYYGYDLIENIGSPRGIKSAESIIPELQDFKIGDDLHISPVSTFYIQAIDPNHFLVWDDENGGTFTWGLYPIDDNHTRLVFRFRFTHRWYDWVFVDWADHIAVKKALQGIKGRVEGNIEPFARQNIEISLWAISFLELCAAITLIMKQQNWWRSWLVAVAAAAMLLITLFVQGPLYAWVILTLGVLAALIRASHLSVGDGTGGS
jgi:hypothetical protein